VKKANADFAKIIEQFDMTVSASHYKKIKIRNQCFCTAKKCSGDGVGRGQLILL